MLSRVGIHPDLDIAVLYLDTPERGTDATALARQLAAVLNRYLPARLNEISDKPGALSKIHEDLTKN